MTKTKNEHAESRKALEAYEQAIKGACALRRERIEQAEIEFFETQRKAREEYLKVVGIQAH